MINEEWIDENKEKPPFDMPVLCYCRIYGFYIGFYFQIAGNFGNWCDGKDKGVLPPTHWMKLPSRPNSKLIKRTIKS